MEVRLTVGGEVCNENPEPVTTALPYTSSSTLRLAGTDHWWLCKGFFRIQMQSLLGKAMILVTVMWMENRRAAGGALG